MRAVVSLLLVSAPLLAQGPFQVREAAMLEERIGKSGKNYNAAHPDVNLAFEGPSPTNQDVADATDPFLYKTWRWVEVLSTTESYREMGAWELAEKRNLYILNMLHKVQGAVSDNVAFMEDNVGEFYLEARDFDLAYTHLSEALRVRRAALAGLANTPDALFSDPNPPYPRDKVLASMAYRMHVADLQRRLAQLDLAKGDAARAGQRLTESISICNEKANRRFAAGLIATYFQSIALEQQGKLQQAESLWKDAVQIRENLMRSENYWNAQKEMAFFYARRGDFHTAADIARRVEAGTSGKLLNLELGMPYSLDPRPRPLIRRSVAQLKTGTSYEVESDGALSQILAVDKWMTDGPDAAAALIQDPLNPYNGPTLDRGSDAERAEMIAWFGRKVFLDMSILLDGNPPPERVQRAYGLLNMIKGRYLGAQAQGNQQVEQNRGNPNVQTQEIRILDQLNGARELHSHLFMASAMDGKPFNQLQFAASENLERVLSEALVGGMGSRFSAGPGPPAEAVTNAVPADAVFLDFARWDRSDRKNPAVTRAEYGVFVIRKGQAVVYVGLGPAAPIDADIDGLERAAVEGHLRGVRMPAQNHAAALDVPQRLQNLHRLVLAPLEGRMAGVGKILIAPDSKLTLAPIGAFIDRSGHSFLEHHTVTYLGSARDLASPMYAQNPASPPIVVANPDFNLTIGPPAPAGGNPQRLQFPALRGAELEAGDVARALNVPKDRLLTGKAARAELIRSVRGPRIVHFATHSVPSLEWKAPRQSWHFFEFPQPLAAEDPLLQSFIAMAGANQPQAGPEDGLLTGLEVASLHLTGTKLVVLSSCESGFGTPVDGQGVLGLRAAFSMAGAEGLVMSLWPVDDQAGRQFMQFFYSHLGQGAAEALRLAQLDLRSKTKYTDPFYWAGYAYSGSFLPVDPRPSAAAAKPELIVTPTCFEVTTRDAKDPGYVHLDTFRVKIGGVVHPLARTAERASYNLEGTGNEVEVTYKLSMNNGPPSPIAQPELGSTRRWAPVLTVEKLPNSSGITLEIPAPPAPDGTPYPRGPRQRLAIKLKGGPSLFSSLEIPKTLPPLSAYTQATVSDWEQSPLKIESLGYCSAAPGQ
jgi:CHAT domain-containing protein